MRDLILICSDEFEGTTDVVCDWLNHLNKQFLRISVKDQIEITRVKLFRTDSDIDFKINNQNYSLSQFNSYWYRRSRLNFKKPSLLDAQNDYESGLNNMLLTENLEPIKFFRMRLNSIAKLNRQEDNHIVKLEVLYLARKLGLSIPDTLVTRERSHLKTFSTKKIISKAIGDVLFETKEKVYGMMTNVLDKTAIAKEEFFPTLFQGLVDKLLDIRVFYFNETFYSTAIFSQSSEKTMIDFRNYNQETPNRSVPHKLPEEIEEKLSLLMKELNLKSGSIDLAYTAKDEYVFFEVNPVGQFEQVEGPGNYNLCRKIAEHL